MQGNQVVKDAVKDLRELQKSEREVLNQVRALAWATRERHTRLGATP